MKLLLTLSISCFLVGTLYSQVPGWTVNEHDFEHTMSLVAFVNVEGRTLSNTQDRIAAFVNGVCRGVGNLTLVNSTQEYLAYLTIFGSSNNELITFKIYDSERNQIVDVVKSLPFRINEHRGNLLQPYSIAQPALRATATIEALTLKDFTPLDKVMESGSITFKVAPETSLSGYTVEFALEDGAQLFLNNQLVVSGQTTVDFLQPVTFIVRSEDRSVFMPWIVRMEVQGDILVYRRNPTCFERGAIKVTGNREGQGFSLVRQGQVQGTKTMRDGEVLFEGLLPGAYMIRSEGFEKQVNLE